MMFIQNLGPMEVMLIFFLALIIFGPKKLPELGRTMGKGLREFRKGTSGLMDSLSEEPPKVAAPQQPVQQAPVQQAAPVAQPQAQAAAQPQAPVQKPKEGMVIDLESQGNAD